MKKSSHTSAFVILSLLGLSVIAYGLFTAMKSKKDFEESLFWREHTHEVLTEIEKVQSALEFDTPSLPVLNQFFWLDSLEMKLAVLTKSINKIGALTKDNPRQVLRIDSLSSVVLQFTRDIKQVKSSMNDQHVTGMDTTLLKQSAKNFHQITRLVRALKREEQRLLAKRSAINQLSITGFNITFFTLIGCTLALALIVLVSIRLMLKNKNDSGKELLLFRSIINSSDDAIVSKDLTGKIISWNPGATAIFGYERGEIIGKHISQLILPGRFEEENLIAGRVKAGNYINVHETQWKHKDGHVISILITVSPIRDVGGTIIGACNIARDITVAKKTEEELIAKEQQSRFMLDLINDGFILLDKKFCLVYLNKKYASMMNREAESLIGKCVWEEFPEAIGSPTYHAFQQAMLDHQYVCTTDHYAPLNLWHENHVYPTEGGLFVFIRDISQQKQTEEAIRTSEKIYKMIASSIPGTVICLFDKDYRYTLVEGDLLEKIGYSRDVLLGQRAQDVLTPERFAAVLPNLVRVFQGESFTTEDVRKGHDTLTRYVPLKDDRQEISSAMVVVIDISDIQNAQREIVALNVELEQKVIDRTLALQLANKELEAFSYSVAHDLRSPLRAVAGYSTMLLDDHTLTMNAEGNRLLLLVAKNAKKMGVLIDELLTFSKLGRKPMQKSMVDIHAVVMNALADLNLTTAQIASVEINTLIDTMADFVLIRQVFVNLLSNAIKYSSKKDSPHIIVQSRQDHSEIIYSVSDNGVGFDMEYAENLFGVFQRMHSEDEFEGTGVGLAIVQRIIHRHDGKVWAESILGEGSTFFFSLPITKTLTK